MRIRIYTDGACSGNPGPGGWGAVFNTDTSNDTIYGMAIETTNNRMELTAVIQSLQLVLDQYTDQDVFELYSDSAYVLNAINGKWVHRWKQSGWKTKTGDDVKNSDLWKQVYKQLTELTNRNYNIVFIKVKGHAGNTFNELVDKLARQQSEQAQAQLVGK